jgi:hypothetical protein
MLDKIQALSAPPGHSLTNDPGKWAWEQPPRFTDPNQAIDFIVDKFQDSSNEEDMLRLMAAGITIEEIVAQVSFKGFMQGAFNPDVAELIKPAVAMYLFKLGVDNGIMPTMFIPSQQDEPEVNDERFFSILKERNPEVFSIMNERANEAVRLGEQFAIEENIQDMQGNVEQDQETNTFLTDEPKMEKEESILDTPPEERTI